MNRTDRAFAGSIPEVYDRYMVPLVFAPYAVDLAGRTAARSPARVLEVAAGTGAVTRALASVLPSSASIIATDLNQAMLDRAAAVGAAQPVEWRQADAQHLPFPDGAFDAVVCQFGVMFFPDRSAALAEARRVLRPGGVLLFNTWDWIEENEFAEAVQAALAPLFPEDPPRFMERVPHGYHDRREIERDVTAAGLARPADIVTVTERSRAETARDVAVAFCQGTPLRNEIEARDPSGLSRATDAAAEAVARRFGPGPVEGRMQAHVVTVEK
jgi:SAM-dependent methyltransferase